MGGRLDAGTTPDYVVLDLIATHEFRTGLELQVGSENVLDRLYADHLNRSNLFDAEQVRVNEPWRTVWLRLRYRHTRRDETGTVSRSDFGSRP